MLTLAAHVTGPRLATSWSRPLPLPASPPPQQSLGGALADLEPEEGVPLRSVWGGRALALNLRETSPISAAWKAHPFGHTYWFL